MNEPIKKSVYEGEELQFSIYLDDIKKTGVTQCVEHKWEKLNDNEIICKVCMSGALINPKDMEKYVN